MKPGGLSIDLQVKREASIFLFNAGVNVFTGVAACSEADWAKRMS